MRVHSVNPCPKLQFAIDIYTYSNSSVNVGVTRRRSNEEKKMESKMGKLIFYSLYYVQK